MLIIPSDRPELKVFRDFAIKMAGRRSLIPPTKSIGYIGGFLNEKDGFSARDCIQLGHAFMLYNKMGMNIDPDFTIFLLNLTYRDRFPNQDYLDPKLKLSAQLIISSFLAKYDLPIEREDGTLIEDPERLAWIRKNNPAFLTSPHYKEGGFGEATKRINPEVVLTYSHFGEYDTYDFMTDGYYHGPAEQVAMLKVGSDDEYYACRQQTLLRNDVHNTLMNWGIISRLNS